MNTRFRHSRFLRTGWTAAVAVSVLGVAAHTQSGQAAPSPTATTVTYTDPAGDSGTAPDIRSVVVSSDARHQITFRINVAKLAVASNCRIVIGVDADQNAATGYGGFDYMFMADLSRNDLVETRWSDSDVAYPDMSSATASADAGGLTFSINAGELGQTTGFSFFVRAVAGNRIVAGHYDDAPNEGVWTYRLDGASTLTLTAADPIASKARAGKRFIAFITVLRADGAQSEVTYGDVACSATVAGRSLQATAIPTYGPAAGCSWRVPKQARGRILHAAVTVTLEGATVTQTFTARIK